MDKEKLKRCIFHIQEAERLLQELEKEGEGVATLSAASREIQQVEQQLLTKEERVAKQLRNMGIPTSVAGYCYLVDVIILYSQQKRRLNDLYDVLSGKYKTTPIKLGRAVRHAIEISWDRGDEEELFKIFGNSVSPYTGRPTNHEFIARLAEMLNSGEI